MGFRTGRVCYATSGEHGLNMGEAVTFLGYGNDVTEAVVRRYDFSEVCVPTLSLGTGHSVRESCSLEDIGITPAVRILHEDCDEDFDEVVEYYLEEIDAGLFEGYDIEDILEDMICESTDMVALETALMEAGWGKELITGVAAKAKLLTKSGRRSAANAVAAKASATKAAAVKAAAARKANGALLAKQRAEKMGLHNAGGNTADVRAYAR